MFETITRRPRDGIARTRALTTAASILAHAAILAAAVLVPLWYFTPMVPTPSALVAFVAAPPAPSPPPPPAPTREARHETPKPTPATGRIAAPVEAPSRIEPEKPAERTTATAGVLGGIEGGVPGGVSGGIVGGLGSSALPPPPPPPAPAPVRVGGEIKAPALIARVDPEYPALAQAAHLEGLVILEATVDTSGHVESVKVLRSAGLLDRAAIDAVKQWQYSPLRLNGRPTPFVLTVTVDFHLGNRRT